MSITEINDLHEAINEKLDKDFDLKHHFVKLQDFYAFKRDPHVSHEFKMSMTFDKMYQTEKEKIQELKDIAKMLKPPDMY